MKKPKVTDLLTPPQPEDQDKTDRTAHTRKLADGRTVQVKASKVKRTPRQGRAY